MGNVLVLLDAGRGGFGFREIHIESVVSWLDVRERRAARRAEGGYSALAHLPAPVRFGTGQWPPLLLCYVTVPLDAVDAALYKGCDGLGPGARRGSGSGVRRRCRDV